MVLFPPHQREFSVSSEVSAHAILFDVRCEQQGNFRCLFCDSVGDAVVRSQGNININNNLFESGKCVYCTTASL